MTAEQESRQRGRPRSAASHRAVLDATLRLLSSGPYEDLTVERIAAEAGVGKQTIYRWWGTKANVVLEALLTGYAGRAMVPVPDTGDLVTDLNAWMRGMVELGFDDRHVGMTRSLVAAALDGASAAETEHARGSGGLTGWLRADVMPWMRDVITLGLDDPVLRATRNALTAARGSTAPGTAEVPAGESAEDEGWTVLDRLRRAQERGEIRADVDLAAAASALTDPLAFRIVIGGQRSQEWGEALVDVVVRGLR